MLSDQPVSSRVVVFTDLDDTLIQTERKLPAEATSRVGATDRSGAPLSFFTQSQVVLLELFSRFDATIIPVTGRNTDALERVTYNFKSYCVVSHGAVVLNERNTLCQDWLAEIQGELDIWPELLDRSNSEINKIIEVSELDARSRVIVDQGIPSYISVKGEQAALELIREKNPLDSHFYRHENGRNHALLPPYARKQRAVAYLKKRLELTQDDLVLGLGDSLSDLGFMNACQFAMMPTNSQITRERLSDD